MRLSRLGPALLIAALVIVYYLAISSICRRLLISGRISARTFAFAITGRLPVLVIAASLGSPFLFGVEPLTALLGAAAGALFWVFAWRGALAVAPDLAAAALHDESNFFAGLSRGEKRVLWFFIALFVVAAVVVVALLVALAPTG
jgi:hypothetical protein